MSRTLPEDWQFCFSVKGLGAPVDGLACGNMLIVGLPPSDDARVCFKLPLLPNVDKDKVKDGLMSKLRNVAQIYGLVTDRYVDVLTGSSYGKISGDHPFGDRRLFMRIEMISLYDDEERKRNIPKIEKTVSKYEAINHIFDGKSKAFLSNALDYYIRALADERSEEKLIDLMISLESLFSKENDELGLRYSLRTAFLLSVEQEGKRPDIFRNIHALYRKRSAVVHGTGNVKIEYEELSTFQKYVREAIKRLIHIEMPKEKFLELLDQAVYDCKKAAMLNEIVTEAIKKW